MAKLEEQVSANELVQIIRTGKTKGEIVKEYRTSDQELAMMLLPLYRAGQLTKEEFNDFFKGLSLKREEEPEEDVTEATPPPEEVAEAPADTRTRLARVFSRKAKAQEEEEPPEEVAAQEPPEPVEEIPEEPIEELTEEDIFVEEEAPAETAEQVAEPVVDELEFEEIETEEIVETEEVVETEIEAAPETEPEEVIAEPEEAAVPEPEPMEEPAAPAMDETLGKILARLESIEKRLIRIEKNLPVRR